MHVLAQEAGPINVVFHHFENTALWVVLLIVWAICLWKAHSGERWKLPLAGDYAERFDAQRT